MYKSHPIFEPPTDENQTIWRYLDFTKFVSLIDTRTLFFARADQLGDRFEGSASKLNVMLFPQLYQTIYQFLSNDDITSLAAQLRRSRQGFLSWTFANCWHMNEHESAAMWGLYLKSDEGIAIKSSFARLKNGLTNATQDVYIGKVKYIDYGTEWIPDGNTLSAFLHKRKGFEHERELRAIIQTAPVIDNKIDFKLEQTSIGINIPVVLDSLIATVHVSPTSSDWFYDLVKSVLKRYQIPVAVKKSSLADDPVY
jgi:hypothetical protein